MWHGNLHTAGAGGVRGVRWRDRGRVKCAVAFRGRHRIRDLRCGRPVFRLFGGTPSGPVVLDSNRGDGTSFRKRGVVKGC